MKTYNISPTTIEITPSAGGSYSLDAITLGEWGRGRKQVIVPAPLEAELLEPGTSRSGKLRLNKSQSEEGWLARISSEGAYIRNAKGKVYVSPDAAPYVQLLTYGMGAFGDAGRIGTWEDVLLCTDLEDFLVRVKPTRGAAYILWFDQGRVVTLSYPEAEALEANDVISLYESTDNVYGEFVPLLEL